MMKKLVRIERGQAQVIEPKIFEKEQELQEIVKNYPELIPLEEIGEEFEPILIIGHEFSLGDAGFVDLLGIDASGLLTIIEFKLGKNADIRKAVAQTIEYAANFWGMTYHELDQKARDYFQSERCPITELKGKKTLSQAVAWHQKRTIKDDEGAFSEDDFRNTVSTNLVKGQFRLILFCDEVDSRTQRTVEYLHALSRYDFYCASAEFFDDAGVQFIRPFLVTEERDDKQTGKQHAGKISFEEFIQSIPDEFKRFVPIYQKFSEELPKINGHLSMGTKGFGAYFPLRENPLKFFDGYPDDIWIITKAGLEKRGENIPSEAKLELEDYLKKTPHFKEALSAPGGLLRFKFNKIGPAELEDLLNYYLSWHKKWFADVNE